jgi:LPXTG-motif cell wall-anchored protein
LTSTNGRVYFAGDVVMGGGTQTGLEIHNYPFRDALSCVTATTGTFSIAKTLTDADGVVTPGRTFTGTWTCRDFASVVVASGTWSLTAGGLPYVTPAIASGSTCSVAEDALAAPTASDASYSWVTPVISPATIVVPSTATVPAVTVHNEVRRGLGDLEMIKILDDPYDVVDLARIYTGTFQCLYNGVDLTPGAGTWATTAGAAPLRLATGLPIGTVCTLAEDALVVPPLVGFPQYYWDVPRITPATVTIADGVVGRFTVLNIVIDPIDLPRLTQAATLAHTGTDAEPAILFAGGIMLFGAALLFIGMRRRVARHADNA